MNSAVNPGDTAWVLVETWHRGKPTALGAASGAVAGLVAIAPASGFVGPVAAIAIGRIVSLICYAAIMMKGKLGYDDSLDVFGRSAFGRDRSGGHAGIAPSLDCGHILPSLGYPQRADQHLGEHCAGRFLCHG